MPDYDYGNARIKAMKSRLLTPRELDSLLAAGDLQGMIAVLTKTSYQKSVEIALTRTSGMDSIDDAIRSDLENTVGKIRTFYTGSTRTMVDIWLRSYDVQNIKTILRGLAKHIPADEIYRSLLPVGSLRFNLLRDMTSLDNPREAIDMLVSLGQPEAEPLVSLRAERPGARPYEFELALDHWHYRQARRSLQGSNRTEEALYHALAFEADMANILTALRFARQPAELESLYEKFKERQVDRLFVGPGHISFELLAAAAGRNSVAVAVETLSDTPFGPYLEKGLRRFRSSDRLSDIEKELRTYRLKWMVNQLLRDPLGIGVVLGYTALKTSETGNVRWIARGIELGLAEDVLRDGMEVYS